MQYNVINPRTHTGSDIVGDEEYANSPIISIHAPTRGATMYTLAKEYIDIIFQSTPPHGERPCFLKNNVFISLFQSTPPHGERQHPYLIGF